MTTAVGCLRAWRKYAKFSKNKAYHESEIVLFREENTKRQFFQEWFNAAMARAPMSLFCIKVERAKRRIELRQGYQRILEQAVRDQDLDQMATNLQETRHARLVSDAYSTWRGKFRQIQLEKYVAQKQKLTLVERMFGQWREAFQEAREVQIQDQVQQQAIKSARAFYDGKLEKTCFSKLVWNLISKRQSRQARVYYQESLKEKALGHMKTFAITERERGSFTAKSNHFKRDKRAQAACKCLGHWRFQAAQTRKAQQIVDSLKMYKGRKLLRAAFGNWRRFASIRREIRERNDQSIDYMHQVTRQRQVQNVFDSFRILTNNR